MFKKCACGDEVRRIRVLALLLLVIVFFILHITGIMKIKSGQSKLKAIKKQARSKLLVNLGKTECTYASLANAFQRVLWSKMLYSGYH